MEKCRLLCLLANNIDGRSQTLAPGYSVTRMEWFEEYSGEVQVMFPFSNSADINPVQHLWIHLKNRIHVATLPSFNVWELQDQLRSTSYQIPLRLFVSTL
ncbi:hypothetical protein TNCV_3998621 [Trichonephila clavipes]|nr:hypothetical protein TNCV_3998621 [Trichonephila clavipes]